MIFYYFSGFLPTFGPGWVNLYGSTRNYNLLDEHTHLNDGLGEGVSFRGRLLISVKTDIIDSADGGPNKVEVEPTLPVPEVCTSALYIALVVTPDTKL